MESPNCIAFLKCFSASENLCNIKKQALTKKAYNNFNANYMKTKLENNLDFDLSIIYGFDQGKSLGETFKVEGKGLKGKILFYLKQFQLFCRHLQTKH